jgi:hypothetical protein
MAGKKKNPCVCLTCSDAKRFDDGQKGILCDVTLEACFMDCDNYTAWVCSIRQYIMKKEKRALARITCPITKE